MSKQEETKEITLSDGRVAAIGKFLGKHIIQAQRLAGSDQSKITFCMISTCVTIDGKKIVPEELDEMEGKDVLKLMAEFEGNF